MTEVINIENSKAIHQIGFGGFGKIFLCQDNKGNQFVSKQIDSETSFLNELKFYRSLREETDYFPKFYDFFNGDAKKCIFMENCQEDLRTILDRKEEIYNEMFILHISKGLKVLKEKNIIHCDLKPGNILYDAKSDLFKICDFGISCFDNKKKHYPVQTMYYRAPEVIFRKPYSFSIDIWSFGCIIYEILYSNILFQYLQEEECFLGMMIRLGLPPKTLYQDFYDRNIRYENGTPILQHCTQLPDMIIYKEGLGLRISREDRIIRKCLQWDPDKRATPEKIIDMYEASRA
jgi:serine/threonine protein kinase